MKTRVKVLVEDRYREQAQPRGLVAALRSEHADRVQVTLVSDQQLSGDPVSEGHDVVVARGRSDALLAALEQARQDGIPVLDPAEAIRQVRDKGRLAAALHGAGLPHPTTWSGTGPDLALRLHGHVAEHGLLAKPRHGDNSRGITVLDSTEQLAGLDGELLVQELVPGSGADLKLYVIGEQVWATRKPSPVLPCHLDPAHLGAAEVTADLRDLALACGRLTGLSLYGVDCVESPEGVVVIEVNDFPNYTHVPSAGSLLARHVLGQVA